MFGYLPFREVEFPVEDLEELSLYLFRIEASEFGDFFPVNRHEFVVVVILWRGTVWSDP